MGKYMGFPVKIFPETYPLSVTLTLESVKESKAFP
jgi:hypothetical protein